MDINYFSFTPFFEPKSTLKPRIVSNTDDDTLCLIKIKRMSYRHYTIKNFVCDKLNGNLV